MICVSLGNYNFGSCIELIEKFNFVEIRLDLCKFNSSQLQYIFGSYNNLIATYHNTEGLSEELVTLYLKQAVEFGARYIDIDSKLSIKSRISLLESAKHFNCKTIFSYHNYDETPSEEKLKNIMETGNLWNFDYIKIACLVNNSYDSVNLLSLYKYLDYKDKLTVIGMGKLGSIVRIAALKLGAPFTYCSPEKGYVTAEGQLDFDTFMNIYNEL